MANHTVNFIYILYFIQITRLLEDSLGGNCKTTMMAMISPSTDAFLESVTILSFNQRDHKKIKKRPFF